MREDQPRDLSVPRERRGDDVMALRCRAQNERNQQDSLKPMARRHCAARRWNESASAKEKASHVLFSLLLQREAPRRRARYFFSLTYFTSSR